jgi:hypothetical protein
VREYDLIAEWYASVRIDTTGVPEATALASSLPRGSLVLDIALLSEEHRVVSLDSSGAMLRHFRLNYPTMPVVQADRPSHLLTTVDFLVRHPPHYYQPRELSAQTLGEPAQSGSRNYGRRKC